ncbi:helix-turn-helix domain-containing protein [Mycolicibacterium nivoides]|uniref:helix-turn-helix domain-containing protein n=1 Tax=Mycolicibacterium nivoides TaxID=2487344 RepID=UPI0008C2691A|nr:helix-turn-helix domain-containing protein [Mycolicibacterium nivoides]MBN3512082.1 helix-turn-helix domain-containing protein [Mycolicibacterium septicum]SEP63069.1 AraC-type DNA-binding protein [Mycobacterium sp. 88mf]SFF07270.1 AraC-type DNA-binding protein [Mycobacterium sp. 455mf]
MEAPRAGGTVMFESVVNFAAGTAVHTGVHSIRRTSLHRHPGVVEIAYALRGGLRVQVSCETFELEPGDFAVINAGDPHLLSGSADNVTALVHIDLAQFHSVDPFVQQIIFACESFDLPRYCHQEALMRGMLLDLVGSAMQSADIDPGRARAVGDELVRLLCTGYSLENYYNREAAPRAGQREKFLTILGFVREHLDRRDVLELTAAALHYSKSYVSHLVKDVAAVSFSDLLGFLRVSRAELLLLTTDDTMLDIAAACGFSDVKYFTRTFVDWFHRSPMEYRKRCAPDILRDSDIGEVPVASAAALVRDHRRHVASPAEQPRLSVTPLLLKNIGSRMDLFDAVRSHRQDLIPSRPLHADPPSGRPHLVPIRVEMSDLEDGHLVNGLPSFEQIHATACLVLGFSTKAATLALVDALAQRLPDTGQVPVWLTYGAIHDRGSVDEVVAHADAVHGLQIQAIFIP